MSLYQYKLRMVILAYMHVEIEGMRCGVGRKLLGIFWDFIGTV